MNNTEARSEKIITQSNYSYIIVGKMSFTSGLEDPL